ncbi:hemolysin III family protein [Candidatus Poribacteria bacterium]|nr:hemolysin III family protein [Candidatus Poribacteria bacterium]
MAAESRISSYSPSEELANAATHGAGAVLSVAGLVTLIVLAVAAGDPWRIVSFSIYGASLVVMYLASTLYHSFRHPKVKRVFRVLDHASIYLLIAGSYTPFTLVAMRGGWGWSLFGIVWGLALAGIVLKIFFTGRFRGISAGVYLGMGWLVMIAIKPLLEAIPMTAFVWLAIGGAAYSLGVVFYLWRRLPYHHAVWHVFVLAGSICQFIAVVLAMGRTVPS